MKQRRIDCKKAHFTHFESAMLHLNFLFEMTLIINSNPNWHCSLYYPLPKIVCKNESSKLPKCCHFGQVKCQILMTCKSILISKNLSQNTLTKKWPPGDKEFLNNRGGVYYVFANSSSSPFLLLHSTPLYYRHRNLVS